MSRLYAPQLRLLAVLLAAALLLRGTAAVWWQARLPAEKKFAFADSESYWAMAQQLYASGELAFGSFRVFRTPGYPWLLSGLFHVYEGHPPVLSARMLGAVLGTLAVAAVAGLAWQLFDRRVALAAGLLATLYPGAIAMSVFILSEAPFCPLMLGQLMAWVAAWRSRMAARSAALAVAAGALAGCATLVRPSWLLFTPAAAMLAIAFSPARRRHFAHALLMLLGLSLVMLPWWVRSYRLTGHFVLTTLQVGASLYDGVGPQATGASDMEFVPELHRRQREADARAARPLESTFEYRVDRRMRDEAVAEMRARPGRILQLAWTKFLRMWNVWPNAADFSSWTMRLVVALGYAPLLLAALWGIWQFAGRGWPWVLCILPAGYFTALHVIFVSSIRYRQPPMLPLIVLAAAALVHGAESWYCGGRKRAAA